MKDKLLWKTISYLLHPLFMPTLGVCFLIAANPSMLFSIDSPLTLLMIPWTVLGCTALFPLFCILTLLKAGKITSLEEPSESDRLLLIVFSEAGFLISFIAMPHLPAAGHPINMFLIGINIALTVTLVLSFFTRTSLHATGVGGLLGTVIGLEYYARINLTYWICGAAVLAILAGYARFKLKAHNSQEIYMGYLVGLLSLSLVFILGS